MNHLPPKSQKARLMAAYPDRKQCLLSLSPSGAICVQNYLVGFIVHLSGANVICGGMQFRLWYSLQHCSLFIQSSAYNALNLAFKRLNYHPSRFKIPNLKGCNCKHSIT